MKKLVFTWLLTLLVITPYYNYIKAFSVNEIVSKAWNTVTLKKEKKATIKFRKKVVPQTKVTLNNINGPITIDTWDNNEIIIEVEKCGIEKRFENTIVTEKATDSSYILTTKIEDPNEKSCTVSYTVLIPKNAILFSINNDNGSVTINNTSTAIAATTKVGTIKTVRCTGNIKLHSDYGDIIIEHMSSTQKDSLVLSSSHGSLYISVPKTFNSAHINASAPRGKINSSIPITTTITTEFNKKAISRLSKNIDGTIGRQESKEKAHLKLQAERGNIIISTVA